MKSLLTRTILLTVAAALLTVAAVALGGGVPAVVDPKRTGPNQMRAPSVNGGTTYHVSKGDVITIPAKTPHWFKEVPSKTIAYYAVNIESK
jgi:hypothetical protein